MAALGIDAQAAAILLQQGAAGAAAPGDPGGGLFAGAAAAGLPLPPLPALPGDPGGAPGLPLGLGGGGLLGALRPALAAAGPLPAGAALPAGLGALLGVPPQPAPRQPDGLGPLPALGALGPGMGGAAAGVPLLGAGAPAGGPPLPGGHAAPPIGPGPWVVPSLDAWGLTSAALRPGLLVEVSTVDGTGVVDGTALFRLSLAYGIDAMGQFAEATFEGASSPIRAAELEAPFRTGAAGGAGSGPLLHFCSLPRNVCRASAGARKSYHVDSFRIRDATVVPEPWARSAASASSGSSPFGLAQAGSLAPAQSPDARVLERQLQKLERLMRKREAPAIDLFSAASRRARRRSADASSSEGDGPDDRGSLFREAPTRSDPTGVQMIAQLSPGSLFEQGIGEAAKYLGERAGAAIDDRGSKAARAQMVTYLVSVLHGRFPQAQVGPRSCRELRTLAEALDALGVGDLPRTGDILMQRFKSIETSITDQTWEVAAQQEVIPPAGLGLTTTSERHAASRAALLHKKLEDVKRKSSGKRDDG